MSDTWTCRRCGRALEVMYQSHECAALSEAHVNLPSEPASNPAADLARLRAEIERLAEELEGSPPGKVWCSAYGAARLRALLTPPPATKEPTR